MKKLLLSLSILCSSAFAASDCNQFVAWGFPQPKQNTVALCQLAYYTSWDPATKNPAFSAEYLLSENVSGVEVRQGEFKQHPSIPSTQQSSNADYSKSGFDRGHMAPAGDMRKDSAAMVQSFYLTNMVPQYPELNRKVWASFERYVRARVLETRPLFVITGPLYDETKSVQMIGAGVWVPTSTYKVVYDKSSNTVASYVIYNEKTVKGSLEAFYVPFDQLETRTGIKFFPSMPADVRASMKQVPLKTW